jgi:DNA-binding NarL/FixJ family response regulator
LEIASGVQVQSKSLYDLTLETLTEVERVFIVEALACLPELTEPEMRVFDAIGACLTRQSAADKLSISTKTVNSHMDSIYAKLVE